MEGLTVVELDMMDKRLFFPLCALNGFCIRTLLYPLHLIKTRMQVQTKNSLYLNLSDALKKIIKEEGRKGLYKGFWINNLTLFSQVWYIGAYEMARNNIFSDFNQKVRAFLAGGFASVIGQTTVLPIDIVTQHLQVHNLQSQQKMSSKNRVKDHTSKAFAECNKQKLHTSTKTPNYKKIQKQIDVTKTICKDLYQMGGWKAFYKGYWASLFTYGPSSALWWLSYDVYCSELDRLIPESFPRLLVQSLAAPLGGATTTIAMTPMDAVRARIQVEKTAFLPTCQRLWREEGWGMLKKGLSARLVQSTIFSTLTIISYESIKRFSLLEEYQGVVRW